VYEKWKVNEKRQIGTDVHRHCLIVITMQCLYCYYAHTFKPLKVDVHKYKRESSHLYTNK